MKNCTMDLSDRLPAVKKVRSREDLRVEKEQEVRSALEADGYELLSPYRNAQTPFCFRCKAGHTHKMTWDVFLQGGRCAKCAGNFITPESVELAFAAVGYRLLSKYVNSKSKLAYVCGNGHAHATSWTKFKEGRRCRHCADTRLDPEKVKEMFAAEGFSLLSRYVNNSTKMRVVCPMGHERFATVAGFRKGDRCAVCCRSGGYSAEKAGTLYYIRFDLPSGDRVYKIGITNLTVRKRFASESAPYTVIWQQRFDDGRIPQQMEKDILKKHKKHRYKGRELESGNTECFTIDVLNYDRPFAQISLIPALT